jgi:hypothetical protein
LSSSGLSGLAEQSAQKQFQAEVEVVLEASDFVLAAK